MNKTQIKNKKIQFIDELKKCRGLIATASYNAGVSRTTIYNWLNLDSKFKEDVNLVLEMEGDRVESKFLQSIDEGEVQAQIFYLKTKLKNRGYSERDSIEEKSGDDTTNSNPSYEIPSVAEKIEEFKSMMIDQGMYSAKFDPMIRLTAQTAVRYEATFAETLKPGYQSVITQKSREGNERQITNAMETQLHQLGEQLQSQLRALGLNADAKPIKNEEDGLSDFLNKLDGE